MLTIYDPIIIGGAEYHLEELARKESPRLKIYFENQIGLRFIILSEAYNASGIMPGYVAIYVLQEDRVSEKYFLWKGENLYKR